jgi:hypothetical protein
MTQEAEQSGGEALARTRAANRLTRAILQFGLAQHLEGIVMPQERAAIIHAITRDHTRECMRCGGLFRAVDMSTNWLGELCADCAAGSR